MLPLKPIDNLRDGLLANSKSFRQHPLRILSGLIHGHNFQDLIFCQFCAAVSFTLVVAAVNVFVSGVLLFGAPCQIAKGAVRLDTVEVATLHAVWARSDKCLKHQAMDVSHPISAIATELNKQVSAPGFLWFEFSPLVTNTRTACASVLVSSGNKTPPHRPIVSYAVSWKVWNIDVFDLFWHNKPLCLLMKYIQPMLGEQDKMAASWSEKCHRCGKWPVPPCHLSGAKDMVGLWNAQKGEPGRYILNSHWREDYTELVKRHAPVA